MSLNISLSLLPHTNLDALGAEGPGLSMDEAEQLFELVGAQLGDHVVLIDPFAGESIKELAARAGCEQYFTVMLGGTADVYAIEAVGPLTRLRVRMQGELVEDQGTPLPAEAALADHEFDEDAHLAVFEALLGHPQSALWQAQFYPVPSPT